MANTIDIIMPTYNGAKYIEVLLDSLLAQTFTDWHLMVRDDHSTDNTVEIVQAYAAKHAGKITLLQDDLGNIGINNNFSTLMEASKAPYVCFCDQDDQWMHDKLEATFTKMKELENGNPEQPCLAYSNLKMVDGDLNLIAESLWQQDNIKPHYNSLSKVLVQSPVNGNVMMMNRALVDLAAPIPPEALWFDHWVTLMAAATGKLGFINRTTILYRIHDFNASRGDNRITKTDSESQLQKKLSNENFVTYFKTLEDQAQAAINRLQERNFNNTKSLATLETFIALRKKNILARKWAFVKNGFFKHDHFKTIKWLVRI